MGELNINLGNLPLRLRLYKLLDYLFLLEEGSRALTSRDKDLLVEVLLLNTSDTNGRIGLSMRKALRVLLNIGASGLSQRLSDLKDKGYIVKDIDNVLRINPSILSLYENLLKGVLVLRINFGDARR